MLWIVAVVFILGISIFAFFNSRINQHTQVKNAEFKALLELARNEKSFTQLAVAAAKTRFREVTFSKPGESMPVVLSSKSSSKSTDSTQVNHFGISASDGELVQKALKEIGKGSAVFQDPNDSPMMYSRPFLRVEFDGDTVVKIESNNLG